jgi:hypothetical protein
MGIDSETMDERRRHVRAKPTPDLPAHVIAEVSPAINETLDVVDISVGGLALLQGMKKEVVGTSVKLSLVLSGTPYAIEGSIRWVAKGMFGIELTNQNDDTARAIRRFIGELLERGAQA